jgi:pimeloyl-ACP methyl ester carboxylesterase
MAAYNATLAGWPVTYEEQDIPTRYGTTHIISSGTKAAKPLLLLHGQDSTSTSWIYNITALSRAFRIYAVETIGDMGKSRPTVLPKSRELYAGWLSDVLEGLKLTKTHLVGMSYGGFLAFNFALAFPKQVDQMVQLAPGIPNFGPPTGQWANYGLPMMLLPSRSTIKRFIQGASLKGYSIKDPIHEQMIIGMMNMKHVSFMRPVFTEEELMRLEVPALLLIGEYEIMYEPQKALDCACRLIPGLQGKIVPKAGHMLNSDQPEIVDELILNFFSK